MNARKKNQNPLYVVSQKGNVVEEAQNYLDLLIKKWGLTSALETLDLLLKNFVQFLASFITSFAILEEILKQMDDFLARLKLFFRYQI
jgi:hypothetical protein